MKWRVGQTLLAKQMSGPRTAQKFFMFQQCNLARVGADGGCFGPLDILWDVMWDMLSNVLMRGLIGNGGMMGILSGIVECKRNIIEYIKDLRDHTGIWCGCGI